MQPRPPRHRPWARSTPRARSTPPSKRSRIDGNPCERLRRLSSAREAPPHTTASCASIREGTTAHDAALTPTKVIAITIRLAAGALQRTERCERGPPRDSLPENCFSRSRCELDRRRGPRLLLATAIPRAGQPARRSRRHRTARLAAPDDLMSTARSLPRNEALRRWRVARAAHHPTAMRAP